MNFFYAVPLTLDPLPIFLLAVPVGWLLIRLVNFIPSRCLKTGYYFYVPGHTMRLFLRSKLRTHPCNPVMLCSYYQNE